MYTNEATLIQDVESLRTQFPQAKDLYKEVCHLLFFKYEIQPTANRLYQLVRKGTMSLPADAINHFWHELRVQHSINVDHPGLPDTLREFAGEALTTLWKTALELAKQSHNALQSEIDGLQDSSRLAVENYKIQLQGLESVNAKLQGELKSLRKQLQQSEKKSLIDGQVLKTHKEALKTLQNEKSALEVHLKSINSKFSVEVNKLKASLKLSGDHLRKLEEKSTLEVDRERQRSMKLELEHAELKRALLKEHAVTKNQAGKNQRLVIELRENIGLIKEQLKESQRQQLAASNKLKQIERKKQFLR